MRRLTIVFFFALTSVMVNAQKAEVFSTSAGAIKGYDPVAYFTVGKPVKGDPKNPNHISATMPGTVIKVVVEKGEKVEKGDHLLITEAMKMETTVQAPFTGVVKDIYVKDGEAIQNGDLLIELSK